MLADAILTVPRLVYVHHAKSRTAIGQGSDEQRDDMRSGSILVSHGQSFQLVEAKHLNDIARSTSL